VQSHYCMLTNGTSPLQTGEDDALFDARVHCVVLNVRSVPQTTTTRSWPTGQKTITHKDTLTSITTSKHPLARSGPSKPNSMHPTDFRPIHSPVPTVAVPRRGVLTPTNHAQPCYQMFHPWAACSTRVVLIMRLLPQHCCCGVAP